MKNIIPSTCFIVCILFITGCIISNNTVGGCTTKLNIDEILEQLMSFEEYRQIISKHARPYTYELSIDDRALFYFGAEHSFDPSDPMFVRLEHYFHNARPDIVLVEGIQPLRKNASKFRKEQALTQIQKMSINEAKRNGEGIFAARLALQSKIEVLCPEPSLSSEIEHILKMGFRQDHIFVYNIYRSLSKYYRSFPDVSLEEYLKPYMPSFKAATNWKNFDYSIEHLIAVGKEIWGRDFDITHNFDHEIISPTPKLNKQTVINEISRQSAYYRDAHIIQEIMAVLSRHKKVFIVYGSGHAVMQEKALRIMFKKYNES